MQQIRPDIMDAVSRMHVTFGIRSTIRNLPESLEAGELVQAMVACFYSGSDGLLVLTDRRVIAVRDDFSKFRLQAVPLTDTRALDYAPTVHDGLAVLTDTGRIAVRKMNRQDSDAFAAALVAAVPGLVVGASRPQHNEPFRPEGGAVATDSDRDASFEPVAAPAEAAAPGGDPGGSAEPAGVPAATPPPATPPPAPPPAGEETQADKEVLLGVLADLHAKGLLSADELAAKIAQVTASR